MFEKNQVELIKEIEESEERDNEETDSLQDGRLSQLVSDSPDLRRLRKRMIQISPVNSTELLGNILVQ